MTFQNWHSFLGGFFGLPKITWNWSKIVSKEEKLLWVYFFRGFASSPPPSLSWSVSPPKASIKWRSLSFSPHDLCDRSLLSREISDQEEEEEEEKGGQGWRRKEKEEEKEKHQMFVCVSCGMHPHKSVFFYSWCFCNALLGEHVVPVQ